MIEICNHIRWLYELGKDTIDLPYFRSFPKNSCEGASLFLGAYLKEVFPNSNIVYVKGYNKHGAIHFWLEIDGKVFDPTLDQFDGFDSPLWSADSHPLKTVFADIDRQEISEAFKSSDVTNSTYKNSLMVEIRYFLEQNV
ncbi:hypothetical protein [Photobacterium damselae]|uniref:hypothetical protein n=1 Tax=Photobacterium damselae TaxID=38293 RepID=UPI000D66612D|nr:hypothetical protein [Photobacterium damselae]AWK83578.1 hypothetical protein BST98_16275 [Photobacterium damselae]